MTSFAVHPRRPEITVNGKVIRLNWARWQLLAHLSDYPNQTVSVRKLAELLDYDADSYLWNEYAFQMIYQIRKSLRKAGCPNLIETVRGRGYRLRVPQ